MLIIMAVAVANGAAVAKMNTLRASLVQSKMFMRL